MDEANIVNNLNGNLEIKNNKIFDLNLNSNFTRNEKLFISIKTHKDNTPDREIVTTFYSDRAKPFVKNINLLKDLKKEI